MNASVCTRFRVVVILLLIIIIGSLFWFFRTDKLSETEFRRILLISIDTCRADHLSCYGYHLKTTPNIDTLAKKAILFTNVVSPIPLTLPAHSSMLTGTDPTYHGIHDNHNYKLASSNTTLAEILKKNGFATGAVIGAFVMDSQFGLDQGFDTYNDSFLEGKKVPYSFEQRPAQEVTHFANIWLQQHQNEPFFLFLHYFDPHEPYVPPEPFASGFKDNKYAGEIAYVDECIGRVIQKLKDLRLYDSTLIIITGDHGEMLGEHGERTHGYFIYQSALKVPLIFKLPGRHKSKKVKELVGLIDIVPTICSLSGIELPMAVQGKDISGYFSKKCPPPPGHDRLIYCESLIPTTYNANALLGIVNNRWKYIQTTRPELYDLTEDHQESINLITKEPQRARILQAELKKILQKSAPHSDAKMELDEQSRRRLESLGYVTGSGVVEDFEFNQTKDDPKDLIKFHRWNAKLPFIISMKRYEQAKSLCEKMLFEQPNSFQARSHLAKIAIAQNNFDAALTHLTEAIRLKDDDVDCRNDLAVIYFQQGKTELAIEQLTEAIRLKPDFTKARINMARLLSKIGRIQPAIDQYYRILELEQDRVSILNKLAWILATAEDENLLNPADAVEFAERACQLTDYKQPEVLDTLAVAYAAAGRFEQAIEITQKAIQLAESAGAKDLAQTIQSRIKLYKANQPYSQPTTKPPGTEQL